MESQFFLLGVYCGLGIVGLVALIYLLASMNILFTFVREGTAKVVMRFGRFRKVLISYEGYGIDQFGYVREITSAGKQEERIVKWDEEGSHTETYEVRIKSRSRRWLGGLQLVGWPLIDHVYTYDFRWMSFEQVEKDGKLVQESISHNKSIDYILLQDDVYYTFIKEAETGTMVPVDAELLLTIRIVNPYQALFRVQNWLEATLNLLKPALRNFIAKHSFEELIHETKEAIAREADTFLRDTKVDEYLESRYGVRLKKMGIVNIDPVGDVGRQYAEAATKKTLAERESERIDVLAKAERKRMETIYETVQKYGDVGMFLKGVEAIQEVGKGPSNLVIFPIGSARDLLQAVIGEKKGGAS